MTIFQHTDSIKTFATKHRTALIMSGASFFILTFLTFGVVKATELPDGIITPGVSIMNINVGGLNEQAATTKINTTLKNFTIPVRTKNNTLHFKPYIPNHISYDAAATFNTPAAIQEALTIGRRGGFIQNTAGRIRARFFGDAVNLTPSFNEDIAATWIRNTFELGPNASENAHFAIENNQTIIIPEKAGETLLIDDATKKIKRRIFSTDDTLVSVAIQHETPPITEEILAPHLSTVNELLNSGPVTINLKKETTTLAPTIIIPLVITQPNENGLSIDPTLAEKAINDWAKSYLDTPINAEFIEENGRVTKFTPHKNGEAINAEAFAAALTSTFFSLEPHEKIIDLPIKIVSPEITTEKANPYGIKELIGEGASNFAGSPNNRRHNIKIGADSLNGILIPPGKTLSLIETLGAIEASTGYLPELVIKGDKTAPEYGGGLCQIGTTLFRTALNSGLVIPERRNHSYRVVYYERDGDGNYVGPGTDATIYDPSPDLKITNDSPTTILITTNITGNKITFYMWGAKDGRVATKTDVKVYNITPPPEPKITETPDLPPGQKKCTESAHSGADAVFTYTITYTDGRQESTEFRSHYRPWGEVCLVGIDPNATPITNPDGTPITPEEQIGSADSSGVSGN